MDISDSNRFEILFNFLAQGVVYQDLQGGITLANPAAEQILGLSLAEMQGRKSIDPRWRAIHEDGSDFPGEEHPAMQVLQTSQPVHDVVMGIFHPPKNEIRWILINSVPEFQPDGVTLAQAITSFTDITERKRAEDALRMMEEKYRTILSSLTDNVITVDKDWRIRYINHPSPGIKEEEVIGSEWLNWLEEVDQETALKALRNTMDSGQAGEIEFRAIGPNREMTWFHVRLTRFAESGQLQVVLVARDISERKRVEQTLETLVERLDLATGAAHIGIWDWDIQKDELIWDARMIELYGLKPDEFQGGYQTWLTSLHPDDRAANDEITRRALRGESGYDTEFRIQWPDGSTHWLKTAGLVFCDENGTPIRMLGANYDISEVKRAEQNLRLSEEKYRRLAAELEERVRAGTAEIQDLFENAPSGYHSLDAQGNIIRINQTELKWLGYSHEEVIGRPMTDFVTPASRQIIQVKFLTFKQRGWLKDLELEFVRRDGTTLPVLVSATAIYDQEGNYIMSRSAVLDNTERKQAETALLRSRDELKQAYALAEKALRAKDEFLANMSHELRTPLNGILGLSEILLTGYRGPLNEEQTKFVHGIDISGRHLLSLINDVLDLSKINSGAMEIQLQQVELVEICQSSLFFVGEDARKKGIQLELIHDPALSSVLVDPLRLKQIIVNLLSNAIKFTSPLGNVKLKTRADLEQERFEVSVSDNGIGIQAEDLPRLFKPFSQLDTSLSRQHEGTGLGLALVKSLAELHGGSVSVTSEVGKGSSFSIFLPWKRELAAPGTDMEDQAAALEHENHRPPKPAPGSMGTLLLAEDSEINILVVSDYMRILGFKVIIAKTGKEALALAEKRSPDIILMDIQMPEMDGLEAIRRLRADPRFAKTPIIALTALVMKGDRERCLEAGADEYISKPVRLNELGDMVRNMLGKKK